MMQSCFRHVHEQSCLVAERMPAGDREFLSRHDHTHVMIRPRKTGGEAPGCGLFSACSGPFGDLSVLTLIPYIQEGGDLSVLTLKGSRHAGDHLPGDREISVHHVPDGGVNRREHIRTGFDQLYSRGPRSREREMACRHNNAYRRSSYEQNQRQV